MPSKRLMRKDLVPGMLVQNSVSGKKGIVRGKNGRLDENVGMYWVSVNVVRISQCSGKPYKSSTIWEVKHLKIVKAQSRFTKAQLKELLENFDAEDIPFLETL